jgi:hypothetical protein
MGGGGIGIVRKRCAAFGDVARVMQNQASLNAGFFGKVTVGHTEKRP